MSSLAAMLQRPGLSMAERALLATQVAIARGDWTHLAECVRAGRTHDAPRIHLEETLLQSALFFGFPRAVSAFEVLQREWPTATAPTGGGVPREQQAGRGRALFGRIYGNNTDAVLALLGSFHTEFCDFVLEAAYGRILARPGLTPRQRELLAVTALAALDQRPQLIAHARGALTFGATPTEIGEALYTALGAEDAVAQQMLRIRPS